MTHIVNPTAFKTKKAFKEAVERDPQSVYVSDPSIFSPKSGTVDAVLHHVASIAVTNHPKRTWFAAVERTKDGKIKVT